MRKRVLRINDGDNVGVVVDKEGLSESEFIEELSLTVLNDLPLGHKIALKEIKKGEPVYKFGHVIGVATVDIKKGEHVHSHNLNFPTDKYDSSWQEGNNVNRKKIAVKTFKGFKRKVGRAGTRNYIVVLSSVNCTATVSRKIVSQISKEKLEQKGIHGVVPVVHSRGCAQGIGGLGFDTLNKTLCGWIYHPNVVGALIVELGCEQTTESSIMKTKTKYGFEGDALVERMGVQESGGTLEAIEVGVKKINSLIDKLPDYKREDVSISNLMLATNCGGSDAFSGVSANPLLGEVGDILVSNGATSLLAEIPECHGAEDFLLNRCLKQDEKRKLDSIFQWWKDYSKQNAVTLNNNLSLGNIKGGLTTILEKSLGAVTKGGHSPIEIVLDYSEPIKDRSGFGIMNTPGFDPASVTGLAAGGCNLVCFTTGRGSTYGCSIAPTIKISTTSELAKRMSGDIDFNGGHVLDGASMDLEIEELLKKIISVAEGEQTLSEILEMGHDEFVPWGVGETL